MGCGALCNLLDNGGLEMPAHVDEVCVHAIFSACIRYPLPLRSHTYPPCPSALLGMQSMPPDNASKSSSPLDALFPWHQRIPTSGRGRDGGSEPLVRLPSPSLRPCNLKHNPACRQRRRGRPTRALHPRGSTAIGSSRLSPSHAGSLRGSSQPHRLADGRRIEPSPVYARLSPRCGCTCQDR